MLVQAYNKAAAAKDPRLKKAKKNKESESTAEGETTKLEGHP